MKISIWGSRGSVPVSGPDYVRYGGDTTCVEIRTDGGEEIIFDAGTGIRPLGNHLISEANPPRDLHLFLTHAHWDHVMGFPFFKPLYKKQFVLNLHGCSSAQDSIKGFLEETMRPPFFPVSLVDVGAGMHFTSACTEEFAIGATRIRSMAISHPNEGFGFRVTEKGRSFVFVPDNELTFLHPGGRRAEDYTAFAAGADLLIHDAEYRPDDYPSHRSWGHSMFLDTVDMAAKAGVKKLLLWHLNQDRTDAEVDAMAAEARCAAKAAGSKLEVEAAAARTQFVI